MLISHISPFMLNVIEPSVVMLSVVAPHLHAIIFSENAGYSISTFKGVEGSNTAPGNGGEKMGGGGNK